MNLKTNKDDIYTHIKQLIDHIDSVEYHPDLADAIWSLLHIHQMNTPPSDLALTTTVIDELRRTFSTFNRYTDRRKVAIFGSARTPETHPEYLMAEAFAKLITQKGYMVITGAGGGIMEAGNKGSEFNMDFGVNINLPFEQHANPYIANDQKCIDYNYFFTRKLAFVKESDATALFPGGYGTQDELFEILTLIQTGRTSPRPIVMLAHPDSTYWHTWETFIRDDLLSNKLISSADLSLFTMTDSVETAVEYICRFYRVFHSIRYIENTAILRLHSRLDNTALARLNHTFSDIITDGQIKQMSVEDIPEDAHCYPDKIRLVFSFNMKDFGRLTELIRQL